jgi:hypothetical protein
VSIKVYDAYRVAKGADPFEVLWSTKRRAQADAKKRLIPMFHDILDGRSHSAHLRRQEKDKLFKAWAREHHDEDDRGNAAALYMKWLKEECPPELDAKDGEHGVYGVSNEEILTAGKREIAEGVKPGVFDVDAWMHAKYGEQLTRYQRDLWALDVAVTMRRYRGTFYLIPYCDRACLFGKLLDFMADDERLEDFGYWNNTDPPEDVSSQAWTWRGTVWNDLTKDELWAEYVTVDIVSWPGWSDVSPMMDVARERGATSL